MYVRHLADSNKSLKARKKKMIKTFRRRESVLDILATADNLYGLYNFIYVAIMYYLLSSATRKWFRGEPLLGMTYCGGEFRITIHNMHTRDL